MTMRSGEESPSPPSYARPGDVLAGKFRIERVLGRGGMGIVVAASHVKLGQTVAIKFLLPSLLGKHQLATRLLREARAAAALKGEHVARVFDVDLVEGAPYIVMEYLEGQTLASLLGASGRLAPELAVDYALEACEALAQAHALGIVHRDLKPSNLFLARGPGGQQALKVLDFGISKAFEVDGGESTFAPRPSSGHRDASTFSGTDSHALMGSPPYVSPEQLLRPRDADGRSDIWSLGVVLYQCLSGRVPFQGETLTKLWDSILRESAPALGPLEPPVPPELERVVRRCLEKDPALRYANVRELAREIAPLGSTRARASLEVIDRLATDDVALVLGAEPSNNEGNSGPELDQTLTEAPTTREQTPDKNVATPSVPWLRSSKIRAIAGAVLLLGLFLAVRPEQRDEPAPPSIAAPAVPVRAPPPARAETNSERPEEARETPSNVELPRPIPRPSAAFARTHVIRRERATAAASSAAASSAAASSAAASSSSTPPPVDVLGRAEELLGQGQISEACAVGQVAAASAPDSARVLEFLGRCYMRLGSVDQARTYYRRYLELHPNAPNAAFVRAMLEPRAR